MEKDGDGSDAEELLEFDQLKAAMEKPGAGLRLSQRDIISLSEEKSKDEKAAQMKQALNDIFAKKKDG